MPDLIERAGKLKVRRDILRSRNANIQTDMNWYITRHDDYAVGILREFKRKNEIKIDRLNRRIAKIAKKYENKGRHVAARKKEKN